MNADTIKGNWNVTKGKLKQKYAQLTDNDLTYVEGKEDELLGRIQQKTGQSRQAIEQYLKDDCNCTFPPSAADQAELLEDDAIRMSKARRAV